MLLPLALITALHLAPPADSLVGAWQITGDVSGTAVIALCTFKQAGATLSGGCADQTTTYPLTGEVKDGKVTFQYQVDYQGQPLTVVYSATFASPTELKGTIDVRPMGAMGTFSAKPAPAKP